MTVKKAMSILTIIFIIDVSTCIFLLGDFHFECNVQDKTLWLEYVILKMLFYHKF